MVRYRDIYTAINKQFRSTVWITNFTKKKIKNKLIRSFFSVHKTFIKKSSHTRLSRRTTVRWEFIQLMTNWHSVFQIYQSIKSTPTIQNSTTRLETLDRLENPYTRTERKKKKNTPVGMMLREVYVLLNH